MNRTSSARPRRDWATLPNLITLLRLGLVVPIVILILNRDHPGLTVVLLAIFGASDWIDGYLARALNQVSTTGAILDPITDRVSVATIALALVLAGHLSFGVVLTIAAVDAVLVITYLVTRPSQAPKVSRVGKMRTAALMSGLALIGLSLLPALHPVGAAGRVLCIAGAVLHAVAGFGYFRALLRDNRKDLSDM